MPTTTAVSRSLRLGALLMALWLLLAALPARPRTAGTGSADRGSVTLEQVAIAAGLLAIAIGAVAVIGKAVTSYTGLLE
jgi:hypothetical protein